MTIKNSVAFIHKKSYASINLRALPSYFKPKKYAKELTLFFLGLLYFLIATNTQSGWLFLLCAFLLGLLLVSWPQPRLQAAGVTFSQSLSGKPCSGKPISIYYRIKNERDKTVREALLTAPAQAWSREKKEKRWVIPSLTAQQEVLIEHRLTPTHRGEHYLKDAELTFAAPLGIFPITKKVDSGFHFLVYPQIIKLALNCQPTSLASALRQIAVAKQQGESTTIRSMRLYLPGDDLRRVHWKASAKRSDRELLVREQFAERDNKSAIILDTSFRPQGAQSTELFEKAVTLSASLLWAARKAGASSRLIAIQDGKPVDCLDWNSQYSLLARIKQHEDLLIEDWLCLIKSKLKSLRPGFNAGSLVITAAASPNELKPALGWLQKNKSIVVAPKEASGAFKGSTLLLVDIVSSRLQSLDKNV